jgi:hypothetical protein
LLLRDGSGVRTTMVQLPAVNTPQFEWVLSRMPGRPRPVAPVYQPEVGPPPLDAESLGGEPQEWFSRNRNRNRVGVALLAAGGALAAGLLRRSQRC